MRGLPREIGAAWAMYLEGGGQDATVARRLQVRLPDERRRALQAEAETRGGTPSEVIRLHLDRYAEMAWRALPKLSDNAWCAVFEATGAVPVDVAAVTWIGMTVAVSTIS
jgi:hypothetical protein